MNIAPLFMMLDAALALSALTWVLVGRMRGTLSVHTFWQFWLGFAIGLTWEVPFYLVGPQFSTDPPYVLAQPFPFHPIAQPILHSLWDAALFLIGLALVRRWCRAPHFVRARWQELAVLVAWGQAQELCVELLASGSGTWTFLPRDWNPALFAVGVGHVTLVPQLIWLVAPIVFYGAILGLEKRV